MRIRIDSLSRYLYLSNTEKTNERSVCVIIYIVMFTNCDIIAAFSPLCEEGVVNFAIIYVSGVYLPSKLLIAIRNSSFFIGSLRISHTYADSFTRRNLYTTCTCVPSYTDYNAHKHANILARFKLRVSIIALRVATPFRVDVQ